MFKLIVISLLCMATPVVAQQFSDPTRPLGQASDGFAVGDASQGIQLSSILVGPTRKIAIINGQPLRELQTVKGVGAVVKKIDADAVTLQQGDKVWRVALNNTTVRK